MALISPGEWKSFPDQMSAKRLASGVWKHEREYSPEQCQYIEGWTLDKKLLHRQLTEAIYDPDVAAIFHKDKKAFVDRYFGQGSFDAYTKHKRPSDDRVDAMAYANMSNTSGSTFTGAGTTTTPASSNLWIDPTGGFLRNEMKQHVKAATKKFNAPKRLVRNMPFVCGAGDLLATLQRDFDHWAKPQMRAVHG
jgi:hypothetical protein